MNITEFLQKNTNYNEGKSFPFYWTDDFATECDVGTWYYLPLEEHGFTCKNIYTWTCNTTIVGLYAIYLDEQLICYGYQQYRKSYMEFYWVSKEVYTKVSKFLKSLIEDEKDYDPKIIDKDLYLTDDDIRINYNGRNEVLFIDDTEVKNK